MTKEVLIWFSGNRLSGAEKSLVLMASNKASSAIKYLIVIPGNDAGEVGDLCRSLDVEYFVIRGGLMRVFDIFKLIMDSEYSLANKDRRAVYVVGYKNALVARVLRIFINFRLVHGIRANLTGKGILLKITKVLERLLSLHTDHWIVNAKATKITLINDIGLAEPSITYIPNGVRVCDPINISSRSEVKTIVVVASIAMRKGILEFLKIIPEIKKSVSLKVLFVGRDYLSGKAQRNAEDLGLGSVCTFMGFRSDIGEFLRQADVCVLPSKFGEGCPTSLLEAMAHGCPIVAYDVDGVGELFEHGCVGSLISVDDDSMASAIVELLTNEQKANELGLHGLSVAKRFFSIDQCRRAHDLVFEGIEIA